MTLALVDVDGDGALDVVTGSDGAQNRLYRNNGYGHFSDVTATQLPSDSRATIAVAAADVDGDGDPDLLWGNGGYAGARANQLYLNDGTGRFAEAPAFAIASPQATTWALVVGDVDRDGDLDLFVANSGQNHLLLNDGAGGFLDVSSSHLPSDADATSDAVLGDVDGDGDLDLITVNGSVPSRWPNSPSRLYLNDGSGVFSDATLSRMPNATRAIAVAIGDVDGDQDLDLVLGNVPTGFAPSQTLLLNDGSGAFSDAPAAQFPVLEATQVLAFADVEGDGDLDLLVGNRPWTCICGRVITYRGPNRLYRNDGAGNFTDVTATQLPSDNDATYDLAVGDVDGDGDPDVVLANLFSANRLYLNLQRQLDVPNPPTLGGSYHLDVYARSISPTGRVQLCVAGRAASIPVPPLGTFGLDPTGLIVLPAVTPHASGRTSFSFAVPQQQSLVGVPLLAQALVIGGLAGARLTNVTANVVAR